MRRASLVTQASALLLLRERERPWRDLKLRGAGGSSYIYAWRSSSWGVQARRSVSGCACVLYVCVFCVCLFVCLSALREKREREREREDSRDARCVRRKRETSTVICRAFVCTGEEGLREEHERSVGVCRYRKERKYTRRAQSYIYTDMRTARLQSNGDDATGDAAGRREHGPVDDERRQDELAEGNEAAYAHDIGVGEACVENAQTAGEEEHDLIGDKASALASGATTMEKSSHKSVPVSYLETHVRADGTKIANGAWC